MKHLICLLAILVCHQLSLQSQTTEVPPPPPPPPPPHMIDGEPDTSSGKKIYTFVEQQPEFPGGQKAMMTYLSKNIHYPRDARDNGIEGKVFAKFIVTETGNVEKITIIRGVCPSIDSTVLAVLKGMPKWEPGMQSGEPVSVYYTLPVHFSLEGDQSPEKDSAGNIIYLYATEMPEFPGGEKELKKYLKDNMQYPEATGKKKGVAYMKFIVHENGSVSDVEVAYTSNSVFNEEAIRLVKNMPAWKPAKENGNLVKCYANLMIEFKE